LPLTARLHNWSIGCGYLTKKDIEFIEQYGSGGKYFTIGKQKIPLVVLKVKPKYGADISPDNRKALIDLFLQCNYKGSKNLSMPFSYEMGYENGLISLYFVVSEELEENVTNSITSQHPETRIEHAEKYFIDLRPGEFFRVDRFGLKLDTVVPIKTDLKVDPYAALLKKMRRTNKNLRVVLQFLSQPHSSERGWWRRSCDFIKEARDKLPNAKGSLRAMYAEALEKCALDVFWTEIRLLVTGLQAFELWRVTNDVASALNQYTSSTTGQAIRLALTRYKRNEDLLKYLIAMQDREFEPFCWLRPWRMYFTSDELKELVRLPSKEVTTPNVEWSYIRAERTVPEYLAPPENNDLTIGYVETPQGKTEIYIPQKDQTKHIIVIGRSGTGKSTLDLNIVCQKIGKAAVVVLDPHGKLIRDVLRRTPKQYLKDVIYFDPLGRQNKRIGINPLMIENAEEYRKLGIEKTIEEIARAQIITAIKDFTIAVIGGRTETVWGTRLDRVVSNLILIMQELARKGLTVDFKLMYDIIVNERIRNIVAEKIDTEDLKIFLLQELKEGADQLTESTLNRLAQIVNREMVLDTLSAPQPLSLEKALKEKKIILVNLALGDPTVTALVGSMFLGQLWFITLTKEIVANLLGKIADLPELCVVGDEFQEYACETARAICTGGRKKNFIFIPTTQYLAQIPTVVLKAMTENAGTIISYGLGIDGAEKMKNVFADAADWGSTTKTYQDLINLSEFYVMAKILYNDKRLPTITCKTYPAPEIVNTEDEVNATILQSFENYGYTKEIGEIKTRVEREEEALMALLKNVSELINRLTRAPTFREIQKELETTSSEFAETDRLFNLVRSAEQLGFLISERGSLALTDAGKQKIGLKEEGAPSEGGDHRYLLMQFAGECAAQQISIQILEQGGSTERPDGVIQFDGKVIRVEAESQNIKKPYFVLRNLGKAYKANENVIFLVSAANAERLYNIFQPENWNKYLAPDGSKIDPSKLGLYTPAPISWRIFVIPEPLSDERIKFYAAPDKLLEVMDLQEFLKFEKVGDPKERVKAALKKLLGSLDRKEVSTDDIYAALGPTDLDVRALGLVMRELGYTEERGRKRKIEGYTYYILAREDFEKQEEKIEGSGKPTSVAESNFKEGLKGE
ncbi:MAG: DUF87 domain-containing protein, partial [Candidatus Thermoplasmatota archaeon]